MNHSQNQRRADMCAAVRAYVEADPESAPDIVLATNAGLSTAIKELKHKACDMEGVALVLASKQFRGKDLLDFVRDKIGAWHGKTNFVWGFLFEEEKK